MPLIAERRGANDENAICFYLIAEADSLRRLTQPRFIANECIAASEGVFDISFLKSPKFFVGRAGDVSGRGGPFTLRNFKEDVPELHRGIRRGPVGKRGRAVWVFCKEDMMTISRCGCGVIEAVLPHEHFDVYASLDAHDESIAPRVIVEQH